MKKVFGFIAAVCLLVAACDSGGYGADTYFFEKKTELLTPARDIVIVTYPSARAVKEAYSKTKNPRKLDALEDLQAFSVVGSKVCTIHVLDPKVRYDPAMIGHETVHCLYGDFHPSQNNDKH